MTLEISTLMDGEGQLSEAAKLISDVCRDEDLTEVWQTYHLIGDCLRQTSSQSIAAKVSLKLRDEPTLLAPNRGSLLNHPVVKFSAAASVAVVTFAGWISFHLENAPTDNRLASTTLRAMDKRIVAKNMNPYVLAHQEFSSNVAIDSMAPSIHMVSTTDYGQ
ncbi:MAG: sigma-E factor negative regulatory protein [Burkholderiales bacterium]